MTDSQWNAVNNLCTDLSILFLAIFLSSIAALVFLAITIYRAFFAPKDVDDKQNEKISSYWIWMAAVLFSLVIVSTGSIVMAIELWPSVTSSAIATVWAFIMAYIVCRMILEPILFRIGQKLGKVTGW